MLVTKHNFRQNYMYLFIHKQMKYYKDNFYFSSKLLSVITLVVAQFEVKQEIEIKP